MAGNFFQKIKDSFYRLIINGRSCDEKVDTIDEIFSGSTFLTPPQATVITSLDIIHGLGGSL